MNPSRWLVAFAMTLLAAVACGGSGDSITPGATRVASTAIVGATSASTVLIGTPTPLPTSTPIPMPIVRDIRASRLEIPKLGINSPIAPSTLIPDNSPALPGCPPKPPNNTTLTVPNQGIASPTEALEGIENKVWIFGHSRWQGVPGILYSIQDLNLGDEVFIDGRDRMSGEQVVRQRFVVNGIYLTDTRSGETLVTAYKPSDIPSKPLVMLQTSVREDGGGKSWLLTQDKVLGKAKNLIEGDLGDPCKYLLLFVFAEQG